MSEPSVIVEEVIVSKTEESKIVSKVVDEDSLMEKLFSSIYTKKFDFLSILMKVFDFIDDNEDMKSLLNVKDKIITIRKFLNASIDKLVSNNAKLHHKYSELVNELFADTYDIGAIISLIMKLVQEVAKVRKMDGPAKKQISKIIFDRILQYSPLNEEQMKVAHYSFSGIVEAIIWAKNGGLKKGSKHLFLLCQ